MPLPCKNPKFRFKQVNSKTRVRMGICKGKIVEIVPYRKANNKWIKGHTRRIKR